MTENGKQRDVFTDKIKAGTDIGTKIDGELTVNGKTIDSPAIESKNVGMNLPVEFQTKDWPNKLSTYAASGEDEIVVVVRDNALQKLDNGRIQQIEDQVNGHLDDLQTNAVPDEVDIGYTTYNELSE